MTKRKIRKDNQTPKDETVYRKNQRKLIYEQGRDDATSEILAKLAEIIKHYVD